MYGNNETKASYSLENNSGHKRMRTELRNHLITGLLSSPILYIPHFHYHLIDEVLEEICTPVEGRNMLNLTPDQICEYHVGAGVVNFKNKKKEKNWLTTVEGLVGSIADGKRGDLNECKVFLIKGLTAELGKSDLIGPLQLFAEKYERGMYDPLMTIIFISDGFGTAIPAQLENIMTIVEIQAPSPAEINEYVGQFPISSAELRPDNLVEDICRNLQGLQYFDVKQILRSTAVRTGGFLSQTTSRLVLEEKKRVVKKSGIIEVVDTNVSFDRIGGLNKLRQELKRKAVIFKHLREAEKYKISLPKGILIIGMPGCGKSMIAKAVASEFGVSLLRLDISRLMGQYVGQSEANLRKALRTAEAAHPCVLWIDEIEKAFAGSSGRGGDDMLVMRLMGHFLTWMQERETPVYIVATANDVMRPEFMRKGRFDDVYFVNFPNKEERKEIFRIKVSNYEKQKDVFDTSDIKGKELEIVKEMEGKYGGFSGAEIESIVNTVFEKKFTDFVKEIDDHRQDPSYQPKPRKVTVKDFKEAVESIKSSVMSEQVSKPINEKDIRRDKTNIERIRDMQRTYKFTVATEGNDVKDND